MYVFLMQTTAFMQYPPEQMKKLHDGMGRGLMRGRGHDDGDSD